MVMSKKFLDLSAKEGRQVLLKMQSDLNIRAELLEKDVWLCWILDILFKLPIDMAFKGGTSLSKCFNEDLIRRFSEDIDISIDYKYFDNYYDLSQVYNRSPLKNLSPK